MRRGVLGRRGRRHRRCRFVWRQWTGFRIAKIVKELVTNRGVRQQLQQLPRSGGGVSHKGGAEVQRPFPCGFLNKHTCRFLPPPPGAFIIPPNVSMVSSGGRAPSTPTPP